MKFIRNILYSLAIDMRIRQNNKEYCLQGGDGDTKVVRRFGIT